MAGCCPSTVHESPDSLWERLEPLLPKYKITPEGGRPRLPLRNVANGIFYVLLTGCQWKAMPREFGSASAIHGYFQEWVQAGVSCLHRAMSKTRHLPDRHDATVGLVPAERCFHRGPRGNTVPRGQAGW